MVDFTIRDSYGTKIGSINQNVDIGLMVGHFLAMREDILIGKIDELLQLDHAIWENVLKIGDIFSFLIKEPAKIHPKRLYEEYRIFVNRLNNATKAAPDFSKNTKKYIKYFNTELAPIFQEGHLALASIADSLNVFLELDARWKESGNIITYVNESQTRLLDQGFSEEMYNEDFAKLQNEFVEIAIYIQDYHRKLVAIIDQAEKENNAKEVIFSLKDLDSEFTEILKTIDRCYKICDIREKMANRILDSGYSSSEFSISKELEKLSKLYKEGQITEEEFIKFKRKLLE